MNFLPYNLGWARHLVSKERDFRFLDVEVSSLGSIAREATGPASQNLQLRGSLDREQAMYPDMFSVCVCLREEVCFSLSSIWRIVCFFQVFGGAEFDRILG